MRVLAFLPLVSLLACTPEIPEGRFACTNDGECPTDFRCDLDDNRCYRTWADASECPAGFRSSRVGCVDVDECAEPELCGPDSTCTNTEGAFECSCGAGSTLVAETGRCRDIDECNLFSHDCHANARCVNTSGGFECPCRTPFEAVGEQCVETCVPGNDSDTGTRSIVITHVRVPTFDAFDFDGIDNSLTSQGGVGATAEGALKLDSPGGLDNAFRVFAEGLDGLIDFSASVEALAASGISIELSRLTAGEGGDPCVAVVLRMGSEMYLGTGSLANHVLDITFSNPILIKLQPETVDCALPSCSGPFWFLIHDARARLYLDESNSEIESGSTIGGVAFSSDEDDAYAALRTSSLQSAAQAWCDAVEPELTSAFSAIVAQFPDLHMEPSTRLSAAARIDGTRTTANALSISIELDSL